MWHVGVVDDHESIVEGLRAFLSGTDDLEFAVGAGTVRELLEKADTTIDLVVLDLRLADQSTPRDNVAALTDAGLPTLVYTSGDEPYLVREAAAAGVLGVIRKNAPKAEVVTAIRAAASGSTVASMDWAAALDTDPAFVDLPPRLRQVLELYAAGESAAHVAHATGLSGDTVVEYVDRIRQKYRDVHRDAPTKTDLYKRAVEDGWLPQPRRETPSAG